MRPPGLFDAVAILAARWTHAYRAELARLNPPAPAKPQEAGTTGAVTQVNTDVPARGWRTGQIRPATALDGIGFTATTRQDADD